MENIQTIEQEMITAEDVLDYDLAVKRIGTALNCLESGNISNTREDAPNFRVENITALKEVPDPKYAKGLNIVSSAPTATHSEEILNNIF